MTITSREKSKNGEMMSIFLDGKYAFSIPQDAYIAHLLYEKEELSEEEVEAIRNSVLVQSAREKAVRLLTAKDRSEAQLIEKLKAAGFDNEISGKAVNELKAIGYVDDSRYVLKYASDRIKNKSISKKALKFELEQKGVESRLIDEVLGEFEQSDEEMALRAARKKFGKYEIKDASMEKKVLSFLAHRGFSYEAARSALLRLKGT